MSTARILHSRLSTVGMWYLYKTISRLYLLINPLNPIVHFWLHHTAHCVRRFCISRKGGTGGDGWGHPQGDMHMVAARLGCQSAMVALANSCTGGMDRLRKRCSHLVWGSFLAEKAAWAQSECMTNESADYCMLVNEWAWLRSRVCLLRLEVDLDSVLESELGQKWRYGALKAKTGLD